MDLQRLEEYIPHEIIEHLIELDTLIPLAHHARYWLNPNYVIIVKQHIDKSLVAGFTKSIKEAIWLSLIVVKPKKMEN
jgi:hypothetical protein